jgi:hypothetical protein
VVGLPAGSLAGARGEMASWLFGIDPCTGVKAQGPANRRGDG